MADTKLIRASDGVGEAVRATVTATRSIASTTIAVDAVTNWPDYFIATSGEIGADNFLTPSTVQVFNGHLSGSDIIIDSFAPGYSDLGNSIGDVVLVKPTTAWANEVADVIEVTHNEDGTLKDSIVTTAKIADDAVTSDKLAPTSSTDANGWQVRDYGTWKEYTKTASESSVTINSGANTTRTPISNVPVGVTVDSSTHFETTLRIASGASNWLRICPVYATDSIKFNIVNTAGSNGTWDFYYTARIIKDI